MRPAYFDRYPTIHAELAVLSDITLAAVDVMQRMGASGGGKP